MTEVEKAVTFLTEGWDEKAAQDLSDTAAAEARVAETAPLLEAALTCATEAVRRIRAGQFWPPNENLRHDPFAEMFLGDVVQVISSEAAQKLCG